MKIQIIIASLIAGVIQSAWTCIDIQEKPIESGVTWLTQNCSLNSTAQPLLTVNVLTVDLSNPNVRVVPGVANPKKSVEPITDMAAQDPNFIAGINGGYFWRVDITKFWFDNVCWLKTREEAQSPVSSDHVNNGVGDGLIKIDGIVHSNNCNCTGFSRPAVLSIDGENTNIEVLHRGETVAENIQNAIGAGPNLVSYDPITKSSYIDIPADDDNVNDLDWAAKSAVGVKFDTATGKATHIMLLTTDGNDGCKYNDISCGLDMKSVASLLKDQYGAHIALSMD